MSNFPTFFEWLKHHESAMSSFIGVEDDYEREEDERRERRERKPRKARQGKQQAPKNQTPPAKEKKGGWFSWL